MHSKIQAFILGAFAIICCILAIGTGLNYLDPPHVSSSLEEQQQGDGNDVASSPQRQMTIRGLLGATELLPPFYNNVTAGDAWVFPSSNFDLGAKGMGCECFDPTSKFFGVDFDGYEGDDD